MKKTLLLLVPIIIAFAIGYQMKNVSKTSENQPLLPDPITERTIQSGKIVGYVEMNNSHVWKGIPFAKAPVGVLRWKAPQPAEKWQGTLNTIKPGSVCTQIGGPLAGDLPKEKFGKPVGSEDCLFLNIWAPNFNVANIPKGNARLPVMFWIHGGGNSIGHGGNYDGSVLADQYNVIVVSINYRLGPLGWFTHPALRSEAANAIDKSGNFGTLDIIFALKWVKENIAFFGGNPGNVTVFGESAGARDTISMMTSPLAKGFIHKAIVQSGSLRTASHHWAEAYSDDSSPGHKNSSREIVNQLLLADKTVSDREKAKEYQNGMSNRDISNYLLKKSGHELLDMYKERIAGMLLIPQVFRDGTVLPAESVLSVFSDSAKYNAVPVIFGTNRDETRLFMAQNPKFVKKYLGIFPSIKDETYYKLYSRYTTEVWKATAVDSPATVLAKSQRANVYAYRFDWDEEPTLMGANLSLLLGAAHGLEIPFVFNSEKAGFTSSYTNSEENSKGRKDLAKAISSYWIEFAYTGSPGRGRDRKQVEWKPWNEKNENRQRLMILDTPQDKGIRMSSYSISLEKIKKRLVAEIGFDNQENHCQLYVELFGDLKSNRSHLEYWNQQEYESLGKEGCKAFPRETFFR